MLKIFGCLCVVLSFVFYATNYSSNLKKRVGGLYFFKRLLELFKIKIEYEQSTVPQIIKGLINECDDCDFLLSCSQKIDSGQSLKTAWSNSLIEKADKLGITNSDVMLLNEFCKEVGETDLDGQISNISLYIELLSKKHAELEKSAKDKSRVAINTGFFAGAIVSILLI